MDNLKYILKHQARIPELQFQFECYVEEMALDDVTHQDIMDNAEWTLGCFEEMGHPYYEARVFGKDKDAIKQYKQIKSFIERWEKR